MFKKDALSFTANRIFIITAVMVGTEILASYSSHK